jgi:hypothetical protein
MKIEIDNVAREEAFKKAVIPECLHVPVAAVDEVSICKYIGPIVDVVSFNTAKRALVVKIPSPPKIDQRLPIWKLPESAILYQSTQLWVHVNYTGYRRAYMRAFPEEDISGKVINHILNRRIARIKGYEYVRVSAVTRGVNSSSGYSENWGVNIKCKPNIDKEKIRGGAFIKYADLCELMVMMNIKLGGGFMDVVNEGQYLVDLRYKSWT